MVQGFAQCGARLVRAGAVEAARGDDGYGSNLRGGAGMRRRLVQPRGARRRTGERPRFQTKHLRNARATSLYFGWDGRILLA